VIVRNLHIVRSVLLPDEANPKLIVDPNAVLKIAITPQSFQAVSRGLAKFIEGLRSFDEK